MNTITATGVVPTQGDSVGSLESSEFLSRCTVRIGKGVYMYFCVSLFLKNMTHRCGHLSLPN